MEKNYLVELNVLKKMRFMTYRKFYWTIFPETFIFEVPSWTVRACKKSSLVTEQNFELETNILRRFYFRFAWFYARFNFRCANFDSFSWRVCLSYGVCRFRARVQLKTLWSLLKAKSQWSRNCPRRSTMVKKCPEEFEVPQGFQLCYQGHCLWGKPMRRYITTRW